MKKFLLLLLLHRHVISILISQISLLLFSHKEKNPARIQIFVTSEK